MKKIYGILFIFFFSIQTTFSQRFGNEWIKDGQRYLKITVDTKGIYRITKSDLDASGFTMNGISAKNLQLFFRGTEMAIFVSGEEDGSFDSNDFIEFYANGNDGKQDEELYRPKVRPHSYTSLYTNETSYFLTLGNTNGKRISEAPNSNSSLVADNYYVEKILNVPATEWNFDITKSAIPSVIQSFYDPFEGMVSSRYWKKSGTNPSNPYSVDILLDKYAVGTDYNVNFETMVTTRRAEVKNILYDLGGGVTGSVNLSGFFDGKLIKRDVTTIVGDKFHVEMNSDGLIDKDFWSYFYTLTKYPRLPVFKDNSEYEIKINTGGTSRLDLSAAPATVFGYDVTDILNQRKLNISIVSGTANIYIANTNTTKTVWLSATTKKPKKSAMIQFPSISQSNYDYIIITDKRTRLGAEAYKNYRESTEGGSYKVLISETQEIIDQFNFGERSPIAIKRFSDYMTSTSNIIKNLFLIGQSISQPNMLKLKEQLNQPSDDYVPSFGFPASDIMLTSGLLGLPETIPSIPTGRLVVTTDNEINGYLNKVKEHESRSDSQWQKNMLQIVGPKTVIEYSTLFNSMEILRNKVIASPFAANSNNYVTINKPSSSWNAALSQYEELPVSSDFYTKLNNGVGIVSYFGHGSSTATGYNIGYVSKELPSGVGGPTRYLNKGKYPMLIVSGCGIADSFFGNKDIASDWVNSTNSGAINAIGQSFLSTQSYDERALNSLYDTWFGNSSNMINSPIGDIFKKATLNSYNGLSGGDPNIVGFNRYFVSNLQQNILLGDPAVAVFKKPAFKATILKQNNVSCKGGTNGSVEISISGGVSPYNISPSQTGLSAGIKTFTVSDATGSVTSATATITEPTTGITANATATNVSCNAGTSGAITLTVSGGTPGYTYNWGVGQPTTQNRTGLSAGTYNVTVTDASGCTKTASATITEPTTGITTNATATNVICKGGSNGAITLTVSGGTPGYTYNWGAGQPTTQNRTGLAAGTYNVTVTDASGCSKTATSTITEPTIGITANATATNVICKGGTNGAITLSVSGGTPGYTYNWGAGQPTTQNRTGLSAGTYNVTVTDASGCTKTASATISEPTTGITTNATATNVICKGGTNGAITLTVSGGTPGYTYNWGSGQPTTQNRTGLSAGTYNVIVTDASGCSKTATSTITEPTIGITANATATNVICKGGTNGAITLSVSGGTPGYTYNWGSGQPTTQNRTGLPAGTYTVTVTDVNGCTKTATATITEPTIGITANATATNVICKGGTNGAISLSVSGGTPVYTYNWGAGQPTTQNRTGLSAGTYNVTVTDASGCSKTATSTITEPTIGITANATATNVICNGGTNGAITLTVSGGTSGYTYNWGAGQPTTQNRTGLSAGTYNVTVTDVNGCTKIATATITEPTNPIFMTTSVLTEYCNGTNGSVKISATGGTLPYTFSSNKGNIIENTLFSTNGITEITLSDANGCALTAQVVISECSTVMSGVILDDNVSDGVINGQPFNGSAYLTLIQNGIIVQVASIVGGNYTFQPITFGVYKVVFGTNPNGSLIPSLPAGYSGFLAEGEIGSIGDGTPDGSVEFTVSNLSAETTKSLKLASIFNISFSLKAANALPVTLISFSGNSTKSGNELNWETSSEFDFNHFELERSFDSKIFKSIAEVKAISNSNEIIKYSFYDNINPVDFLTNKVDFSLNIGAYYRLKLVDNSMKEKHSKTIFIKNSMENSKVGEFFPNPIIGKETNIEIFSMYNSFWKVTFFDLLGKVLPAENLNLMAGKNIVIINLPSWNTNISIAKFEKDNEIFYRKLVR